MVLGGDPGQEANRGAIRQVTKVSTANVQYLQPANVGGRRQLSLVTP